MRPARELLAGHSAVIRFPALRLSRQSRLSRKKIYSAVRLPLADALKRAHALGRRNGRSSERCAAWAGCARWNWCATRLRESLRTRKRSRWRDSAMSTGSLPSRPERSIMLFAFWFRWLLRLFFMDTATTEIYTLSLHDAA